MAVPHGQTYAVQGATVYIYVYIDIQFKQYIHTHIYMNTSLFYFSPQQNGSLQLSLTSRVENKFCYVWNRNISFYIGYQDIFISFIYCFIIHNISNKIDMLSKVFQILSLQLFHFKKLTTIIQSHVRQIHSFIQSSQYYQASVWQAQEVG